MDREENKVQTEASRTQLVRRLLRFGPGCSVFDVYAKEMEEWHVRRKQDPLARPPASLLEELLKDWQNAPVIFEAASEGETQQLSWRDRAKEGYTGPRSTYAFDGATRYIGIGYDEPSDWLAGILEKVEGKESRSIVFIYPSRMERDKIDISEMKKQVKKACHSLGIKDFQFFPLYKMDQSGRRSYSPGISNPIRFWSQKKPAGTAAYIIMDWAIDQGRTVEAIRSFLAENGVPEKNVHKEAIARSNYGDDRYNNHVREFREKDPVGAARCDIMLDLMGIGGLNALTTKEIRRLSGNTDQSPVTMIASALKDCASVPLEITPDFLHNAAKHGKMGMLGRLRAWINPHYYCR